MRFTAVSCAFPVVLASKKAKSDRKPSQKQKKNAKMSKSISAKIAPVSAVPTEVPTVQRAGSAFWASRLLAAAAISTALAGVAAVTLGVGRFGVIFELQLQLLASFLLSKGPEKEALAQAPQRVCSNNQAIRCRCHQSHPVQHHRYCQFVSAQGPILPCCRQTSRA
jgi:hypothetical protein